MEKFIQKSSSKLLSVLIACVVISGLVVIMLAFPSSVFNTANATKHDTELAPPVNVKAQLVTGNLHGMTAMVFPGGGNMLITEQLGLVRLIKNGNLIEKPYLDLRSKLVKVNGGYDERGLLGIALHPKFNSNKKFYVFYSAPTSSGANHKGVLAEYKASANADEVDPNSGRIIFTIEEPESNHNGGCIQFGPDGYLYVSLGDGGGGGDKHGTIGNGQNMNTWLGKILRIDVNNGETYTVPKDNPFVGKANVKPEIWAYGLRNTWRFSFDRSSKKLFAGDVGQNTWEEIDIIEKGGNYGWRVTEGTHCYNPANNCDTKGVIMPIADYNHRDGVSVTGGYVYNGKQLPELKGKYIFADWSGPVYFLQKKDNAWQRGKVILQNYPENLKVTAFGEDPSGELYLLTNADGGPAGSKAAIYKIIKP